MTGSFRFIPGGLIGRRVPPHCDPEVLLLRGATNRMLFLASDWMFVFSDGDGLGLKAIASADFTANAPTYLYARLYFEEG